MIIITGSSGGIGSFLMKKFLDEGKNVHGTYNKNEPDSIDSKYLSRVDITNYQQVTSWVENIEDSLDKLVLINCAGANYTSLGHNADIKKWVNTININLVGTFYVIHALLPCMRKNGYGRIINCSSVVAQTPVPGTSAYASSKSGLWGLCKSLASENAERNITVNNLNLGYFDAGMINEVPDKFQEALKEKIPTGKFGDPNNIYNAITFLVDNDYVNGTSIDINGCII